MVAARTNPSTVALTRSKLSVLMDERKWPGGPVFLGCLRGLEYWEDWEGGGWRLGLLLLASIFIEFNIFPSAS